MKARSATALARLQNWYAAHCNTDWEHLYGVKVDTLDNPGWMVHIDLEGTSLRAATFELIEIGDCNGLKPEPQVGPWMTCRVHDKSPYVGHEGRGRVWIGACSPDQLESMLTVFLDWAEANTPSVRSSMP